VRCSDGPSGLSDDAEIDYIGRLEKAVRRLAELRRMAGESLGSLKLSAADLLREDHITPVQYATILKHVHTSEEMYRTLDKLNRIFIIDKPLQLRADLAARRVYSSGSMVGSSVAHPFMADVPKIISAGTSLALVSFLTPHTVESKTSSTVIAVIALIKQELSTIQLEQTQLESKLQPDWFKQIRLEVIEDGGN